MHIRISLEKLDHLIEDLERSIKRNMEFVNENEYAEASGYARGGLISMRTRLEKLRREDTYEDPWDFVEEEDVPPVPEFPTIWTSKNKDEELLTK